MFGFCFAEGPIERWEDMDTINTPKFAALFHGLLARGVYWWPKPTGVSLLLFSMLCADSGIYQEEQRLPA